MDGGLLALDSWTYFCLPAHCRPRPEDTARLAHVADWEGVVDWVSASSQL